MNVNKKQNNTKETNLYNNILLLSRNKIFYTKFELTDTFLNRIHLIFIHISFLFIRIKKDKKERLYKDLYQETFDIIFKKIEQNIREFGYGDTAVNKNMKKLVNNFYNILLYCENYNDEKADSKMAFFSNYLDRKKKEKSLNKLTLIDYFDKYQTFCFDLNSDSVLRGELNFNYN